MVAKVACKCKYNVGKKTVVVKKKIGTPKSKQKDEWNEEFVKKKKKKKKKEVWKKNCNKTWSTKNQYEISLGEYLISLKKFLCMSEYSEM